MAGTYSIQRFFGFKKGLADNLIERGCASAAVNVDTSDGALQTVCGSYPFPAWFGTSHEDTILPDPENVILWRRPDDSLRYVTKGEVFNESSGNVGSGGAVPAREFTQAEKEMLEPFCQHSGSTNIFCTQIAGVPSTILTTAYSSGPIVIEDGVDDHDCKIRRFGTGMFLTSDEVTAVEADTEDPTKIIQVTISRAMTAEERARCLVAGVYIMAHEDDELDYTASYVSAVEISGQTTVITFESPVADVSVGCFVKVRGGLSDMNNLYFAEYYGRLFAAGDPGHPRRLYWSCLPGDGRTVEDWTADDASPDTGGGHVEVGLSGKIVALFAMPSQLLIFKDREVYRLYGTSPSQYAVERVFSGNSIVVQSQKAVANAQGFPYWVNADGIWAYDGSTVRRIDSDRSIQDYWREYSYNRKMPQWLHEGWPQPAKCVYWNDRLFFAEGYGREIIVFDLMTGASTAIRPWPHAHIVDFCAIDVGIVYSLGSYYESTEEFTYRGWNLLLLGLSSPEFLNWGASHHFYGSSTAIDAVWESPDLTFGDTSSRKRLVRLGFEITGSIRLTVFSPEGSLYEKEFLDTTDRYRRMEWLTVDMPYEGSFRIRLESMNGRPFRIHSGIDCYIDFNKRN